MVTACGGERPPASQKAATAGLPSADLAEELLHHDRWVCPSPCPSEGPKATSQRRSSSPCFGGGNDTTCTTKLHVAPPNPCRGGLGHVVELVARGSDPTLQKSRQVSELEKLGCRANSYDIRTEAKCSELHLSRSTGHRSPHMHSGQPLQCGAWPKVAADGDCTRSKLANAIALVTRKGGSRAQSIHSG